MNLRWLPLPLRFSSLLLLLLLLPILSSSHSHSVYVCFLAVGTCFGAGLNLRLINFPFNVYFRESLVY